MRLIEGSKENLPPKPWLGNKKMSRQNGVKGANSLLLCY